MAAKKRDWTVMRTEYVTGPDVTLSKFFRIKKIPRGTWSHHTKGWVHEREKYQQQTGDEIKDVVKKAKVLSAAQQAEYLSGVVAGVLNRWKRLNDGMASMEKALGSNPTRKELTRITRQFNETTRLLPELMKTLELLAGRATARPEVHDKTKKEIEQLQRQYDEKRKRIGQLARKGTLTIVKRKKTKAG